MCKKLALVLLLAVSCGMASSQEGARRASTPTPEVPDCEKVTVAAGKLVKLKALDDPPGKSQGVWWMYDPGVPSDNFIETTPNRSEFSVPPGTYRVKAVVVTCKEGDCKPTVEVKCWDVEVKAGEEVRAAARAKLAGEELRGAARAKLAAEDVIEVPAFGVAKLSLTKDELDNPGCQVVVWDIRPSADASVGTTVPEKLQFTAKTGTYTVSADIWSCKDGEPTRKG